MKYRKNVDSFFFMAPHMVKIPLKSHIIKRAAFLRYQNIKQTARCYLLVTDAFCGIIFQIILMKEIKNMLQVFCENSFIYFFYFFYQNIIHVAYSIYLC